MAANSSTIAIAKTIPVAPSTPAATGVLAENKTTSSASTPAATSITESELLTRLGNMSLFQAGNEGLHANCSTRLATILDVEARFAGSRVLLLRAPPQSGKTTLAQLYQLYLGAIGVKVHRFSLLMFDKDDTTCSFDDFFRLKTGTTYVELLESKVLTYIIIDEIHKSYGATTAPKFWGFIKSLLQEPALVRVLLLGPYSEPPTSDPTMSTPVMFNISNWIESDGLRFKQHEFEYVVNRWQHVRDGDVSIKLPRTIIDMIWSSTAGHCGLVGEILNVLSVNYGPKTVTKFTPAITAEIVKWMISSDFTTMIKSHTRVLPYYLRTYNEHEHRVIFEVLHSGIAADNMHVLRLIREGVFVRCGTNATQVKFSCPLIHQMMHIHIHYQAPQSLVMITSFESWLLQVLGGIRTSQLALTSSLTARNTLKEYLFQCEIYRSACARLPSTHSISPEINKIYSGGDTKTTKGRLDFYVNSNLNWGLELLRDGIALDEHVNRFGNDGKYHDLQLTRWAVIDFRRARLKPKAIDHLALAANVWVVVYARDFTHAHVYHRDHNGTKVTFITQ